MKSNKILYLVLFALSFGAYSLPVAQCFRPIRMTGETQSDHFGQVVVGGADINGDGVPDILVGAPQYSIQFGPDGTTRGAGKVYLFSGADRLLLFSVEPENVASNFDLGRDIDTLGDLNNDGYGDFIVGTAVWIDSLGVMHTNGAAIVFSGIDYSPMHVVYGDPTFPAMGEVVSCIGDITKDGVNDFLAGGNSGDHATYSGIKLFNGATGEEIMAFTTNYDQGRTAQDACGVGDLDGDSYPDFVMGIPFYDGAHIREGRINAYSGKTFELLWTEYGGADGAMLGGSMKGAGDVNGDGYMDVICGIGDGVSSTSRVGLGFSLIISGNDGSIIRRVDSPDPSKQNKFGWTVAGVGDLNHDGYDDYAIGDFQYQNINSGIAWVYSGFDGSPLDTLRTQGNSISTAGDINEDGTPDIVTGSYRVNSDGYTMVGRVYVHACVFPDSTCEGEPDYDNDGWNDLCDNCPYISEWQQLDSDNDGVGDRCTDSVVIDVGDDVLASLNFGDITFDSVTSSGSVTIEQVPDAPSTEGVFTAIPQDFPRFYNISTTVGFNGSVLVCLEYDPTGLTAEEEFSIRLYHYDGSTWDAVTVSIDTLRNKICGVVSSLSPFGIGLAGTPTSIDENLSGVTPSDFILSQNYPNPFNPRTTFSYLLPDRSDVNVAIVNILGKTVRILVNETVSAGLHHVVWDGRSGEGIEVASGVYFYRITTAETIETKKMLLLR